MPAQNSPVRHLLLAAAVLLTNAVALGAQFTAGNLAVVRVGGDAAHNAGASSLTGNATPAFIDEYTLAGAYVQTIALPTATAGANHALLIGGSPNSEGFLHLSTDRHFLTMTGYDTTPGTSAPSDQSSVIIPRSVAVIGFNGAIDTTTALTDFANLNNARAAFSTNGASVWLAGADANTGGIRYIASLGVTTSVNLSGNKFKNCRDVAVFGGQLYFAQDKVGSGSIVEGLGTNLPTSGLPTDVEFPGSILNPDSNSATNSFFLCRLGDGPTFRGFDTMYIADGSNLITNSIPGISKYAYNGATWTDAGNIGTDSDEYQGLTGVVSGRTVTLYVTKPSGIYSLVDPSGFDGVLSFTPTLLATAPARTALRGIAFTPISPLAHAAPVLGFFGPDFIYTVTTPSSPTIIATNATVTSNAANLLNGSLTVSFAINGKPEDQLAITSTAEISTAAQNVLYNGNLIATFSGGANGSPLVISFTTPNATSAAAQSVLEAITYLNNAVAGQEALNPRTVQAVLNDGTASENLSTPVTLRISFMSANNAPPELTIPGPQFGFEDKVLNVVGLSVFDPDAGANPLTLTMSVTHGVLSVVSPLPGGVPPSGIAGNYTRTLTLTGNQNLINTTLSLNLMYLGDTDFNGADTLTLALNDQGNTGPGGVQSDQRNIPLTIAPVNDAPTPVADTATVNRNSAGAPIDVLANDKDLENDPLLLTEVTQPKHGKVSIVNNKAVYVPEPGFTGTDTFTYSMSDGKAPGAQVVDISNAQAFVPLTLDNGLTYFDNGADRAFIHEGGYGSGMCPVPGAPNEFYMTYDRGVGVSNGGGRITPIKNYQPAIFRVRINPDGTSTITNRMFLKNESGAPLNCLPNADNPDSEPALDINGNPIDTSANFDGFTCEGITALADGTFWISDEYGPFLTHFDSSGKIIERLKPIPGAARKLPNVLIHRAQNRGMEGLCVTPDGTRLVGIIQTALHNNGTANVPDLRGPSNNNVEKTAALRIIVFTLATGVVQEYIYLLEQPAFNCTVSEISALSNTDFLVDERDSRYPSGNSRRKRLWHISLIGASDVHDPADSTTGLLYTPGLFGPTVTGLTIEQVTFNKSREQARIALMQQGINPVTIKPAPDFDILQFTKFNHEKVEGMAVINDGKTVVVSNDDDEGIITGQDINGIPAFLPNYFPGTNKQANTQLLMINVFTTVTVTVVNHPPSVTNANLSAKRNATASGTLTGTDPDNDALTFAVGAAANGTLTLTNPATGAYTYTPNLNYFGPDSFTFTANDGAAESAPATITIDVIDSPIIVSAPSATPNPASQGEQILFTGTADAGAVITWRFGDGTTAQGESVTHAYNATGIYAVDFTAMRNNQIVSQSITVTVTEFAAGLTKLKMQLGKSSIVLNFNSPEANADSIKLSGKIPIPLNFVVASAHFAIDIGGFVRAYDLDAAGASANGELKLTVKTSKGVVKKQSAPFTLTLPSANYKSLFYDEGFTLLPPKGRHLMMVQILLNKSAFLAIKPFAYKVKNNIGTAR